MDGDMVVKHWVKQRESSAMIVNYQVKADPEKRHKVSSPPVS